MEKEVKYQSIHISYPPRMYAIALWLTKGGLRPLFFYKVFTNFNNVKEYSKEAIETIRNEGSDEKLVLDTVIVLEMKYLKDYPLKKIHWQSIDIKLGMNEREQLLLQVVDKPPLFNIVITPAWKSSRSKKIKATFSAGFAYLKSQEDQIDNLMRSSTLSVNPEAENAGIYSINKIFGYDHLGMKVIANNNYIKDLVKNRIT